ncbi:uncharacterized protein J8A68_002134 [[Candida] subhashii]|uniref:Spindle pole body-associated protein Vik1/Cik1 microtubule binding domain-containing protein n=1 Tax=[Candida] subhashii TaxID=561895 RepID=A0A8J5UQZ3_9ASCO|nr:uncharacterized protein J8A68_002134 [[Candida] subhashii]KAG7664352.1 hypothetical protein J8A68_002134 [[Candida] subhashii]
MSSAMSNTTVSPKQKKRPLNAKSPSEINQIDLSNKRPKTSMNMNNDQESSIPPLPKQRLQLQQQQQQQQQRPVTSRYPSKIPIFSDRDQPKGVRRIFSADYDNAWSSIQDRLARKSSVNDPKTLHIAQYRRPTKSAQDFRINTQEKYYALNEEFKRLQTEYDVDKKEFESLKRTFKTTKYSIDEVNDQLSILSCREMDKEEVILKEVKHAEEAAKFKLKKLEHGLLDQYKEIELQMKDELQDAKDFDASSWLDEISKLEKVNEEVAKQLEELSRKEKEQLEPLQEKLEKEHKDKLKPKTDLQVQLTQEVNDLQKELEEIEVKKRNAKMKLEKEQNAVHQQKVQITTLEHSMINFHSTKRSMQEKILEIEKRLAELQASDKEKQDIYDVTYDKHQILKNKIRKHDNLRRIIENSIMNYEGLFRVYVISNSNSSFINESQYSFNRVFDSDAPTSYISEEFSCLVKQSLTGSNVSIFNFAASHSTIDLLAYSTTALVTKISTLNKKKFELGYQCVSISLNNDCLDLLNSGTKLSQFRDITKISSQEMRIEDGKDFTKVVEQVTESASNIILHRITIEAKGYTRIFSMIDMSRISKPQQIQILQKFISTTQTHSSTPIDILLSFAYTNSKCLFIVAPDEDVEQLDLLQTINSTDSPYQRKS